MAYKTNITKEFKGKGFYDPSDESLISSGKNDSGASYSIKEIFEKIGQEGNEIEVSVKVKEQIDSVDEESQE